MITIRNINIEYDNKKVISEGELIIPDGKITAIAGKSGAGKTSLLYILGLISCFRGYDYTFNGEVIDVENDSIKALLRKKEIGFVFQDKNLHDYLTVRENLKLYCLISGNDYSDDEVKGILDKVNLDLDINTKTLMLSGGEKQRLAIACALMKKPSLIIADEPTSALDNVNSKMVIDLLKAIAKEGKMVVIATHDKSILEQCDYTCIINDSQIFGERNINTTSDMLQVRDGIVMKGFYRWYNSFQYGRSKLEKKIFRFLPIITIVICAFFYYIKRI